MNQSKVVAIPRNLLKEREKSWVQVAIDFGFFSLFDKLARDF